MASLEHPNSFQYIKGPGPSPKGPKINMFKKRKNTPRDSPKFQVCHISDIFCPFMPTLEGCKDFWSIQGPKTESPGPKNQDFQKMKKRPPGIHPCYKCARFQTDLTIYAFNRAPQSLQDIQTRRHTQTHTHRFRFYLNLS